MRAQLLKVNSHRLASKQMDRDGIGGEGVDNDEVVCTVWRFREREPPIAERDRHVGTARLQEVEQSGILGNPNDGRVDLVKMHCVVRLGVASE